MAPHTKSAIAMGKVVDMSGFKKSYENYKMTILSVKSEIQSMKVPSKQSAKDFHAAELKYIDSLQEIGEDFNELMTVIDDKKIDQQKKEEKVRKIQSRVETNAKAADAALVSAQTAFARDYNVTIIK